MGDAAIGWSIGSLSRLPRRDARDSCPASMPLATLPIDGTIFEHLDEG
ncbi:hypothetical protein [Sphingopyxis sp.]|nr:hypothetical protein [Sphingopyxis sp.]HET6525034.1 hypothetical protein [Sphingopyxis sp.]